MERTPAPQLAAVRLPSGNWNLMARKLRNVAWDLASRLRGAPKEERQASAELESAIDRASAAIAHIADSFGQPWRQNPGAGTRAVLGLWANKLVRHLIAIGRLSHGGDLSQIAEVHYRQMIEIWLQVREFARAAPEERERLAQRISAFGSLEFVEKLEQFKDTDFGRQGYQEAIDQVAKYDDQIVKRAKRDRERRKWYWFGRSFSTLAREVAREGEDLEKLYHLTSAQAHGVWDVTFGVSSPEPGVLLFGESPDALTSLRWATELVDRATQQSVLIWNEIADATGAPRISS